MRREVILAGVVIAIVVGGVFIYLSTKKVNEKIAVFGVVENFGAKLQMVPLMASREVLVQAIRDNYSPFISEGLLDAWTQNPERAPGRLTSSSWPDRIDIILAERDPDGSYTLQGKIIEVTGDGKTAGEYQVAIKLREVSEKWVITGFTGIRPR